MQIIHPTNRDDKETKVGDIDELYLNQWNWQINDKNEVTRSQKIDGIQFTISMARVIAARMGLDLSNDIDHIDRDRLNNQRENLRAATRRQNLANRGPTKRNNTGFKGVSVVKSQNPYAPDKYRAIIKTECYKNTYLGVFYTAEDAARMYDYYARRVFGEFAWLNFPDDNPPLEELLSKRIKRDWKNQSKPIYSFEGVTCVNRRGTSKYIAEIKINGSYKYLGAFDCPKEAAEAIAQAKEAIAQSKK